MASKRLSFDIRGNNLRRRGDWDTVKNF